MTTEVFAKSYMLDLSLMPKGIYFMQIIDDVNKQSNKKIIIN
jgi:hypothetical protein